VKDIIVVACIEKMNVDFYEKGFKHGAWWIIVHYMGISFSFFIVVCCLGAISFLRTKLQPCLHL
jgi:hypothetical protein